MKPRSLLLVLVALGAAGCDRRPAASGGGTPTVVPTAPREFAQIYTVRGQVHSLPDPADARAEFQIHHEAIPEFVDSTGQMAGMRSMTMPFPTLSPGVSLDGLSVGDKIRFTFGVAWEEGASRRYPTWTVTKIDRLPADTVLQFAPPAPEPAADGEEVPTPPG